MRTYVIGSSCVHLLLLVALLVTRPPTTVIVPGPDIVQVSLIDTPPAAIVTPPAPAAAPKPEPVAIKPTEPTGIKLPAPKPKPARKAVAPQPEAPPALPAPALPYASVGPAGLQGAISLDTNFEFTYYLTLVRNRIAQAWAPPAGLTSGGKPVQVVLYFRIARDGGVSSLRIETGSGYEYFDRSAVRAVQLSDPLPPLPLGYASGDLGVHFGFQFVAP